MQFTKMHGAGNDYVYINGFDATGAGAALTDPASVARAVSDRHFGIGADGLVLVLPSEAADVRMRMFNADGSEAQMCGNAIRCVAKLAHEKGLATANPVGVETACGVKTIEKSIVTDEETGLETVPAATVDMGEPILDPASIPVTLPGETACHVSLAAAIPTLDLDADWVKLAGLDPRITCVSMGNPHVVLFCRDVQAVPLEQVGPLLETASIFPERINVHFAAVDSPASLTMRTWERGSGITLACGTGAAAVCVAGILAGLLDRARRNTYIQLPGGDLILEWREQNNRVYMTGPAETVFEGVWQDETPTAS